MEMNLQLANMLANESRELFRVEYVDPKFRKHGSRTRVDTAVGLLAYLLSTDVVISLERVD